MFPVSLSKKSPPPILSRTTAWSAERVAALPSVLEVRQLLANAERLEEPELAAICTADLSRRRREQLQAPKPPAAKPRAAKKSVGEAD